MVRFMGEEQSRECLNLCRPIWRKSDKNGLPTQLKKNCVDNDKPVEIQASFLILNPPPSELTVKD